MMEILFLHLGATFGFHVVQEFNRSFQTPCFTTAVLSVLLMRILTLPDSTQRENRLRDLEKVIDASKKKRTAHDLPLKAWKLPQPADEIESINLRQKRWRNLDPMACDLANVADVDMRVEHQDEEETDLRLLKHAPADPLGGSLLRGTKQAGR